jgi:hypothetical protein
MEEDDKLRESQSNIWKNTSIPIVKRIQDVYSMYSKRLSLIESKLGFGVAFRTRKKDIQDSKDEWLELLSTLDDPTTTIITNYSIPFQVDELECKSNVIVLGPIDNFECTFDTYTSNKKGNPKHAYILEGVEGLGNTLFSLCENLETISLSKSLVSIGENVFDNCKKLTSIVIPPRIDVIPIGLFAMCISLSDVTLPSGLTEIQRSAFYNCTSLKNIVIPSNVKSIGNYAFCQCKELDNIKLPSGLKQLNYGLFFDCLNLKNVDIPEGVTHIDKYVFRECNKLERIKLPDGLKTIDTSAFYNSGIREITIPDGVTIIEQGLFQGCKNLKTVNLPTKLKTIRENAFNGCVGLMGISIPASVEHVSKEAFRGVTDPKIKVEVEDVRVHTVMKRILELFFYKSREEQEKILINSIDNLQVRAFLAIKDKEDQSMVEAWLLAHPGDTKYWSNYKSTKMNSKFTDYSPPSKYRKKNKKKVAIY